MKCAACGAEVSARAKECRTCKTTVGATSRAAADAIAAGLFAKIEQSPEFAAKDSAERRATIERIGRMGAILPLVILGGVGVLIAGMLALVMPPMIKAAPVLAVFPVVVAVVCVLVFRMVLRWSRRLRNAPVVARAAVVVSQRTHVIRGDGKTAPITEYYLTCAFEDGTQGEYAADADLSEKLAATTAKQTVGVLFSQSCYALDFDVVQT